MVIADFSGDFLNYDSSSDGDIVEIIDEGKTEFNQILNKNIFNMKVSKNGKIMTWSPNNEAGRIMQETFGRDTKDWVGKKFEIVHIQKKMKVRPIKTEKAL